MLRISAVLFVAIGTGSAFLFDNSQVWDSLKSPWGVSVLPGGSSFKYYPRTAAELQKYGWSFKDSFCNGNTKFAGYRYWKDNDPTSMLLFDKNGYISGIQYSIVSSIYQPSSNMKNHPSVQETINGKAYYTMTAYFVKPETICAGRSSDNWKKYGTGYMLAFQNGTTFNQYITPPMDEQTAKNSMWTGPKCFPTMGEHFWYNIRYNMDCGEFFPFCLLYNKGKLNAFCFAVSGYWDSQRVDNPHPTTDVLSKFFVQTPKCFSTDPRFKKQTTMHVYLTSSPLFDLC